MKLLFLTLVMTIVSGGFVSTVNAQKGEIRNPPPYTQPQQISVRVGKLKKATRSKLTVKFVSIVEDSRCPEGTQCVWAGNAKIKVTIKEGKDAAQTFEINTNTGARAATCGRYTVFLTSLTPSPKANGRINKNGYTAIFDISVINR